MTEYIEREAVLALKKPFPTSKDSVTLYQQYFISPSAVEKIPAADVVPVVRCKDCKNCEWKTDTCTYGWCREQNRSMMRHEYCSDGVKREAEHG